jgi:hypothetical protein
VTLVFRKLDSKVRWYKDGILPWLTLKGDIPADPLNDVRTQDNALSVWLVDDGKQNLNRVALAIAATRQRVDKLDYLLFDLQILSDSDVETCKSRGTTPDEQVNDWHLDLVELSGLELVSLVRAILTSDYETGRFLPKEVVELLKDAVKAGQINQEKLNKGIKSAIVE